MSGQHLSKQVAELETWDNHWNTLAARRSIFARVAQFVRRQILSRAVRHYTGKYFGSQGLFVECGCGTAQSSLRIKRGRRHLVAVDFSAAALAEARSVTSFRSLLQADIRFLPIGNDSVSGIWNLGVMEHFDRRGVAEILTEFRRVLAPGGVVVLFWPPSFGSSRWVLAPIEWMIRTRNGREFRFFPDEVTRLRSKDHAAEILGEVDLEALAIDFTPRDLFIHLVVVARKPTR